MRCPFTRCSLPARETRLGNSEGLRIQGQTKREQPPNWRSINIYWAGRSTGCPASTAHHLFRGCPAAAPSEGSDASEVFPMLLLRKGTFESSAWSKAELGASTTGLGGFVPRLWHLFSQVYARCFLALPFAALLCGEARCSQESAGLEVPGRAPAAPCPSRLTPAAAQGQQNVGTAPSAPRNWCQLLLGTHQDRNRCLLLPTGFLGSLHLRVNPTQKFYLKEAEIVSAGWLVKQPELNLGKSTGFYRGSDTLRNEIETEESWPTSVGLQTC